MGGLDDVTFVAQDEAERIGGVAVIIHDEDSKPIAVVPPIGTALFERFNRHFAPLRSSWDSLHERVAQGSSHARLGPLKKSDAPSLRGAAPAQFSLNAKCF
jgi:hypothetical protein